MINKYLKMAVMLLFKLKNVHLLQCYCWANIPLFEVNILILLYEFVRVFLYSENGCDYNHALIISMTLVLIKVRLRSN